MMKKLLSLTLCLALCLAAAGPARAEKAGTIREAAAAGGDALWELVNTHYAAGTFRQEGTADLRIWQPDGPAFAARAADSDVTTVSFSVMIRETAGVGFTPDRIAFYEVTPDGMCFETDHSEAFFANGPVYIAPYDTFGFSTAFYGGVANGNTVVAVSGTDDNGHSLEFYGVMQLLNSTLPSAAENPEKDMEPIRHEADFEVRVADGVWWVPVRALGGSRYTNREIAGMVKDSPGEKQEKISTLYEALQLFRISNFTFSYDNVRRREDGTDWELHKPGRDAVRTNTGCCATDANWLSYILSGDYDMGFLSAIAPSGEGHVINCIYKDGYWYFIDIMSYETDYLVRTAPETGLMDSYRNAPGFAAGLHKAKDPEAYVKYYCENHTEPPARFFLEQGVDECLPVSVDYSDGVTVVTYPEGYDVKVMDGIDPQKMDARFAKAPTVSFKWSGLSGANFRADPAWLAGPDAAEPLTACRPGDELPLEAEDLANGTAVIGGTEYSAFTQNGNRLWLAPCVELAGPGGFNVFDLSFPAERYREELADMDSLILGDLTADISRAFPETQIVFCTREGDRLAVREVLDGEYYASRKVSIRKAEDGSWQDSPDTWVLMITRDGAGTAQYQFGRFFCGVTDEE